MQFDHIRDVVRLDDLLQPAGALRRWLVLSRLSKAQRWIVKQALALRKDPNAPVELVLRTAKHLRLFGFAGLAIRLLLEQGQRDEAARLLSLEGYPKEAAALYESQQKWSQAAHLHRSLGNIYKAAECYLHADLPDVASSLLQESGDYITAGRCLERAGYFRKAAELYFEVGRCEQVVETFLRWKRLQPSTFNAIGFSEIELLICAMSQTALETELIEFLEKRAQLAALVESLESAGREEDARILRRARAAHSIVSQAPPARFSMLDSAQTVGTLTPRTIHLGEEELTAPITVATGTHAGLPEEMRTMFDQTPFFTQFGAGDRSTLWQSGEILRFDGGDVLIKPGEPPPGVMTVLTGSLLLYRETLEGFELAFEIPPCRSLGESWGLFEMNAEIKVVAAGECLVHRIDRSKMHKATPDGFADRFAVFLARHLLERVKPEFQPSGHPLFAAHS